MTTQRHDVTAHINAPPEKVLSFIADVRNRTRYVSSLKALTDVKGDPSAAGATWKWKFAVFGREFEGAGRCLAHEPGKRYSFQTTGGLESTWNYQAEPEKGGTKLTVHVEFKIPEGLAGSLPPQKELEAMKQAEGNLVIQNLKAILEH
jgi:carbon monoxide dehydrogenase subunit G